VAEFAATEPFPLDPFQVEACAHLAAGRSVLVAAPTGTGKTVVADCAIWLAQRNGLRAIYTAPVKALSNQKYRDLRARHGDARVGLLTGDIVENPAAPILVMTTEIYRNMLLEGSRAARELPDGANTPAEASDVAELARRSRLDEELSGVGCVVFDEMHFIGDQERGPVWEEAIIHSPAHVIFVGLSATVSNADELRRWIERAHGPMGLVFHAERAVPLEHYYFFENRLRLTQDANGLRVERFDNIGGEAKLARMRNRGRRFSFGDDETNQQTNQQAQPKRDGRPYWKRPRGENPTRLQAEEQEEPQERPAPEPGEVLTALRAADLLPCLYFLPGRKAVEAAAIGAAGHLLVTPEQRARLNVEVQQWVKALPPDDQRLEQVGRLADLLPRGLGFHHAGLLPALKMWVETLFARGDLKAVFSTDTLALGINMPARCVVVGSLSKFDGEQMRLLTPNEYQQLTGRAGRRGMDAHGAAVIPYSPWDAFEPAFRSLTAPLLPVMSAFAIRYNTVLNLWRPHDMERLRRAVAMSLREFQRFDRKRQRNEDWHVKTYGKPPPHRPQEQTLGKAAAQELYATVYVLRALGYIDEDDELSVRGRLLRAIFHTSGIMVADLLLSGALDDLGPAEVAEVASWFTYDSDRLRNLQTLSNRLTAVRRQVWRTQRLVQDLELTNGLTVTQAIEESFHSVALRWWRGTSLGGLLRSIDLAEGDLLVSLNQTIDLLQQLQGAVGQTVDARDLWQAKDRRQERELEVMRERLARLRPVLGAAWRGMLRGSVALSRTIPSMATPDALVAPMAEDTDPEEAAQDRAEAPPDTTLP
jgi:ATP-dependent RNA helicase HelY